jgi:F0F1-type ATP synthase membrane subunit c/vacuolar-type H+-ATPase subunit K
MNAKLLVTAAIGAAIGLAIGYAVFVSSFPIKYSFIRWATDPNVERMHDAVLWAVLGAGVAIGLSYLIRSRSSQ